MKMVSIRLITVYFFLVFEFTLYIDLCNATYVFQEDSSKEIDECSDGKKRQLAYIAKDGNCLFSSISYCIWGTATHHRGVRSAIVDHVIQNWNHFKAAVETEHSKDNKNSYDRFMRADGTWGGNVEISAAVSVYSRNFRIYSNVRQYHTTGEGSNYSICALFYDGRHYSVVEDVNVNPPRDYSTYYYNYPYRY